MTALIAIVSVAILILPQFNQAKSGFVPQVDVGRVFEGEEIILQWDGYEWSGIDLINISQSGVLAFEFENSSSSQVLLNSTWVGTLQEGTTTIILVQVGLVPQMSMSFQAIRDLKVKISKYNGNLTIPNGGLFITGLTSPSVNGKFRASYQFPSIYGYSIDIDSQPGVEYFGVVDHSISRYGSGDATIFLHAGSSGGSSEITLISNSQIFYQLDISITDSSQGSGVIPPNPNQNVSVNGGIINLNVDAGTWNSLRDTAYMPVELIAASNIPYGYDIELQGMGYLLRVYNQDIKIVPGSNQVQVYNDTLGTAPIGYTYKVTTTEAAFTEQYYDMSEPAIISGVLTQIQSTDNDRDGFPNLRLMGHDIFVNHNGTNVTATAGPIYELNSINPLDPMDNVSADPNPSADIDLDGLSTATEVLILGTDPFEPDFSIPGTEDTDGDGLSNSLEGQLGTDPFDIDSDDDYFEDGAEYSYWSEQGYNISADIDGGGLSFLLDPNSDMVVSGSEFMGASLQYQIDYSDFNWSGASTSTVDYQELDGIEAFELGSDPALNDTDGDGVGDGVEALFWYAQGQFGLDIDGDGSGPLWDQDSDADGLSDKFEMYSMISWALDLFTKQQNLAYSLWNDYYYQIKDFNQSTIALQFPFNVLEFENLTAILEDLSHGLERQLRVNLPGNSDADGDSLSDYTEIMSVYTFTVGIDGNISWSLEFGMVDYDDLTQNFNGLRMICCPVCNDSDMDGLEDGIEYNTGTHPTFVDTDFDLLPDGIEDANQNGTREATESDPREPDTDMDGMFDGYEYKWNLSIFSNDAGLDPDNDGFDEDNDGAISQNEKFTNLQEFKYWSNPWSNDTDGDLIFDGYEALYNLSPTSRGSARLDYDGDGLTNLKEFYNGTHPRNPDTDGDLMWDDWEIKWGLDPRDSSDADDNPDNDSYDIDRDGFISGEEEYTNLKEFYNNSNPFSNDTDGDSLPDGWEAFYSIGLGYWEKKSKGVDPSYFSWKLSDPDWDGLGNYEEYQIDTNPLLKDTDGDLTPDLWEHVNLLNPLVNDSYLDPDNDSYTEGSTFINMSNYLEYLTKTDPQDNDTNDNSLTDGQDIFLGNDPLKPDEDGDGLSDDYENATGLNYTNPDSDGDGLWDGNFTNWSGVIYRGYGELTKNANASNNDTDGDNLTDGAEAFTHRTDPILPDTDGDGLPDGIEVEGWRVEALRNQSDYASLMENVSLNQSIEGIGYRPWVISDPTLPDTDGDDVGDWEEFNLSLDPTDKDTDDDGYIDAYDDDPSIVEFIPPDITYKYGERKGFSTTVTFKVEVQDVGGIKQITILKNGNFLASTIPVYIDGIPVKYSYMYHIFSIQYGYTDPFKRVDYSVKVEDWNGNIVEKNILSIPSAYEVILNVVNDYAPVLLGPVLGAVTSALAFMLVESFQGISDIFFDPLGFIAQVQDFIDLARENGTAILLPMAQAIGTYYYDGANDSNPYTVNTTDWNTWRFFWLGTVVAVTVILAAKAIQGMAQKVTALKTKLSSFTKASKAIDIAKDAASTFSKGERSITKTGKLKALQDYLRQKRIFSGNVDSPNPAPNTGTLFGIKAEYYIYHNYDIDVAEAAMRAYGRGITNSRTLDAIDDLADFYQTYRYADDINYLDSAKYIYTGSTPENPDYLAKFATTPDGRTITIKRGISDSEYGKWNNPSNGQPYQPRGAKHIIDKHKYGNVKPGQTLEGVTKFPNTMSEDDILKAARRITADPNNRIPNTDLFEGDFLHNGKVVRVKTYAPNNDIITAYPLYGKGVVKNVNGQWIPWEGPA